MHVKHDCSFKEGEKITYREEKKMEELEEKAFIFTMWNCINLEH